MTPEQQTVLNDLAKEFGADDLALANEVSARIALAGAVSDLAARVTKLETAPVSVPPPPPPSAALWNDSIQTASIPWGFDWAETQHNGVTVAPSDANGVNLSVVPDPAGGPGKALRHYLSFLNGGGKSQTGLIGFANSAFNAQAKSAAGVWLALEMYFPSAMNAGSDLGPWCSIMDWHSLDANQGNRLQTNPGLMLDRAGSMKFRYEWGSLWQVNPVSPLSSVALPVGKWFQLEQYFRWSATKDVTLSTWVDGVLALTQGGVQTAIATNISTNGNVEAYVKWYGDNNTQPVGTNWGQIPWTPDPAIRFSRNVRWGSGRLT